LSILLGLRAILAGDVARHRGGMVRSFSLTDAAVMLRPCVPVALVARLEFAEAYRVIAWL
jgi:hypothetical protein